MNKSIDKQKKSPRMAAGGWVLCSSCSGALAGLVPITGRSSMQRACRGLEQREDPGQSQDPGQSSQIICQMSQTVATHSRQHDGTVIMGSEIGFIFGVQGD